MDLLEVKQLLTRFGFENVKLLKSEGANHTFSFSEYSQSHLKPLGAPTVAGGGKVAVYEIPDVGRLGVSPSNNVVRFISSGLRTEPKADSSHLANVELPPELQQEYLKAKVSSGKRIPFMKKLWTHFNTHKFQGQMRIPVLECSAKPSFGFSRSAGKTARGIYCGGRNYEPGNLWMAEFMFNSREAFFTEVFLHEMCHQSAWNISRDSSRDEAGHGPVWQKWMVHVGLDPRRFDPTDDFEYKDAAGRAESEEGLSSEYGPRRDASFFSKLMPLRTFEPGPAVYQYKGRALYGRLDEFGKGVRFVVDMQKSGIHGKSWNHIFTYKTMAEFKKVMKNYFHSDKP